MASNKTLFEVEKQSDEQAKAKTCFAVMPIADIDGYETGHFLRVYQHLIVPACKKAGFVVKRADETKTSNLIVLDILKMIYDSDLVICDLSAKNPNVMYELGIRQAFELPTVLIKDKLTSRVFDIQALRDVTYDHTLRIDTVQSCIDDIADAIKATYDAFAKKDKNHINSIVSLLGISPAKLTEKEISPETSLILDAFAQLNNRMTSLEAATYESNSSAPFSLRQSNFVAILSIGDSVVTPDGAVGKIVEMKGGYTTLRMRDDSIIIARAIDLKRFIPRARVVKKHE